jgi:hypothetical protein
MVLYKAMPTSVSFASGESSAFRFPTNGKVLCKSTGQVLSVPMVLLFRFPTTGKVLCKKEDDLDAVDNFPGFNSLRPGKCFASWSEPLIGNDYHSEFRFPTNGKVLCKPVVQRLEHRSHKFRFPTTGKVHSKNNSVDPENPDHMFRFPTNGKAHSKPFGIPTRY